MTSSVTNATPYSYSTTNKIHLLSQIIYSCKMHYMFGTVFLTIVGSSKLHIQQRYYVKRLLLPASIGDEMEFLWNALRVSDGLSIHHQGLKTAYTATVLCQTAAATCFYWGWDGVLVKRSACFGRSFHPSSGTQNCMYSNSISQTAAVSYILLLYTQFWAPDDRRKDCPKHVKHFTINK